MTYKFTLVYVKVVVSMHLQLSYAPSHPRLTFGLPDFAASRARLGRPHPWPRGG
jgi:hypothetical protein